MDVERSEAAKCILNTVVGQLVSRALRCGLKVLQDLARCSPPTHCLFAVCMFIKRDCYICAKVLVPGAEQQQQYCTAVIRASLAFACAACIILFRKTQHAVK